MTSINKSSVSMSKQQKTGPNPWVMGGLAVAGGAGVGVAAATIFNKRRGKQLATNAAAAEQLIQQMQQQQAAQQQQ